MTSLFSTLLSSTVSPSGQITGSTSSITPAFLVSIPAGAPGVPSAFGVSRSTVVISVKGFLSAILRSADAGWAIVVRLVISVERVRPGGSYFVGYRNDLPPSSPFAPTSP